MLLFKMNINLLSIDSLLFIICILFLVYTTLNSLIKFIGDKNYIFLDFRISLFTLIFLFIKLSFSLLLTESLELKTYISSIISLLICLLGWYLHNKVVESRKKHFRVLVFYLIGAIIFIWVRWLKQKTLLGECLMLNKLWKTNYINLV